MKQTEVGNGATSKEARLYRSRRMLRVIATFLGGLCCLLIIFVVFAAISNGRSLTEGLIFTSMFMFAGLVLFAYFINPTFSTLRVSDDGIEYKKLIGGTKISWADCSRIRHCELVVRVQGVPSKERELHVFDRSEKLLLLLKTTFDDEALDNVLLSACAAGVAIDKR